MFYLQVTFDAKRAGTILGGRALKIIFGNALAGWIKYYKERISLLLEKHRGSYDTNYMTFNFWLLDNNMLSYSHNYVKFRM